LSSWDEMPGPRHHGAHNIHTHMKGATLLLAGARKSNVEHPGARRLFAASGQLDWLVSE
jgi:hypothetical protein